MRKDGKASISTLKIIGISLILLLCSGIGVMAANAKVSNVRIIFSNDYELSVLTTKTKVSDILSDNHIILAEGESAVPSLEEEINDEKLIHIIKLENSENVESVRTDETLSMENILENYAVVSEKIETLEIEIPYETITKDVSETNAQDATTKVLTQGKNGLKRVTYKITYKNDIEVSRIELETKILKEPVNKVVEVVKKETSRAGIDRTAQVSTAPVETTLLAKKVENIEPKVVTLNATAYTASTCGKTESDPDYEVTALGTIAKAWYTVATGKAYPFGTIIYIPYFKDKPNGGWFVVEDRGGAITNNKLDVYMSTYNECTTFGRRNLECYIYEL